MPRHYRMGTTQSIRIDAAEEAHKQRYGTFSLRKTESHAVGVISDLLTELLEKNSIFDLEKILTSDGKCNSLFIVLSAAIKKEFQLLRFPDPKNPSESRLTSYIPVENYNELVARGERTVACDQITYFIIRLVTLIAALTASIKINPTLMNEIFGQSSATGTLQLTMNPTFKEPVKVRELFSATSVAPEVIADLLAGNEFRRVKTGDKEDSRPLYYFGARTSVVINTTKSIVYMPLKEETAILSISIQPYDKPQQPMMVGIQAIPPSGYSPAVARTEMYGYAPPAAAVAAAAPMAPVVTGVPGVPGVPGAALPGYAPRYTRRNNASSVGFAPGQQLLPASNRSTVASNMTARLGIRGGRSKRTRKLRRQYGGASRFLVNIRQILDCAGECKVLDKFIMDTNGNTFSYDAFKAVEATGTLPPPKIFAERMEALLEKETTKYANEAPQESAGDMKEEYAPIHERSLSTLQRLKNIKSTIQGKPEGTAPSNYRAFLLASRLEGNELSTLFCSDKWSKKRMTSSVAYSLVQSLYDDLPGGGADSRSAAECAEIVGQFVGAKVAQNYTPLGATAPTRFDQIAFLETPQVALKPFCTKVTNGVRKTQNPQHISLLQNAHRQLRDAYDTHIKQCVELIRKMLSFAPSTGYRASPIVQLNPVFEKNPGGSQVALDGFIQEGRKLLVNHFLTTEKIYQGTLLKLAQNMTGNYVEPAKPKNELATINASL